MEFKGWNRLDGIEDAARDWHGNGPTNEDIAHAHGVLTTDVGAMVWQGIALTTESKEKHFYMI